MHRAAAAMLPHPPDRERVAERRRRDEAVLDRAVVALRLAEIDRDRAERLVGADQARTVGHRARLLPPLDVQLADLRRLEDLAPALGAEAGHGRELDVARARGALDREPVAREVRAD